MKFSTEEMRPVLHRPVLHRLVLACMEDSGHALHKALGQWSTLEAFRSLGPRAIKRLSRTRDPEDRHWVRTFMTTSLTIIVHTDPQDQEILQIVAREYQFEDKEKKAWGVLLATGDELRVFEVQHA